MNIYGANVKNGDRLRLSNGADVTVTDPEVRKKVAGGSSFSARGATGDTLLWVHPDQMVELVRRG
jgi:hypothetical protein